MSEKTPSLDVPEEVRHAIETAIASDQSPVGIDAKETHVMILHKLLEIERRLDAIEQSKTDR